ncbi:MAG: DNA mismatch repair endonuclease MutL [Fimbriimonadaceae bacterium]|nr:DNA mismatch repair endonuclease MutL [Fimbriimonadaceae bacterium]QYK56166.1 MAG: DNA mismatch repair endonuclease MutL [Fimbriimonadaceae bacterium]
MPEPIRLLDPHTINQIAAGEVVERPASVVKELVENALDAGATRIQIEIEEAGRNLIEVSDDGHGIPSEAIPLAMERHATSKIRRAADLLRVESYGFRGEALPSIASVARLTLASGTTDGLRYEVVAEDGKLAGPDPVSGPRGTTVRVERLFGSTPARLKFLKTDGTELGACVEAVGKAAVSRPDVRFVLKHGAQTLVATSGSGDPATALGEVWGREVAKALVPVDAMASGVRVRGLVAPPHFTRPTRSQQWFFVNGRPVRSRTLQAALDQAFRSLTPEKRFPVAAIFVDADPARLDINVSPTKSEVRFQQEGAVFDAVRRAVTSALLEHGMVPTLGQVAEVNQALTAARPLPFGADPGLRIEAGGAPALGALSLLAQQPLLPVNGTAALDYAAAPATLPGLLEGLRVFGQVDATFILAENATGVLIIDQHVAHERILFERLRNTRGGGAVETQALVAPETLHVGAAGAKCLAERLDELRAVGYELEPFGGESFVVRAVPALWRGRSPLAALRDMAEELVDGAGQGCLSQLRDDVFAMASCKMAVKAGDPLAIPEMERLLHQLAETENPYFCPHGRPITYVLPKGELYRRFKRC